MNFHLGIKDGRKLFSQTQAQSLPAKGLRSVFLFIVFYLAFNPRSYSQVNLDIIAKIESNNNPLAVSKAGATGEYQLMPVTRNDYKQENPEVLQPTDRDIAVWLVTRRYPQILRSKAVNKSVTLENILVCYNCGCGCLNRKILPKETRNYLKKYRSLSRGNN